MRLLNTKTWKLESYPTAADAPFYAILSHRWREDEVTFEDFMEAPLSTEHDALSRRVEELEKLVHALHLQVPIQSESSHAPRETDARDPIPRETDEFAHLSRARRRKGWAKVEGFCDAAQKAGLSYVWVDTFCIDQKSSAELSESVNSMFSWYEAADICMAYLDDVSIPELDFKASEWHQRGWTMQELLAPNEVKFFQKSWTAFGLRSSLAQSISRITRIPETALVTNNPIQRRNLHRFSVAARFSWAAGRQTTRPEDRAYSLMGVMGVNIPTIYGEGEAHAFFRLQSEVFRATSDQSIFAWGIRLEGFQRWRRYPAGTGALFKGMTVGMFALSPDDFIGGDVASKRYGVIELSSASKRPPSLGSHSPRMTVQWLYRYRVPPETRDEVSRIIWLECKFDDAEGYIAIEVRETDSGELERLSPLLISTSLGEAPLWDGLGTELHSGSFHISYIPPVTIHPLLLKALKGSRLYVDYSDLLASGFVPTETRLNKPYVDFQAVSSCHCFPFEHADTKKRLVVYIGRGAEVPLSERRNSLVLNVEDLSELRGSLMLYHLGPDESDNIVTLSLLLVNNEPCVKLGIRHFLPDSQATGDQNVRNTL